MRLAPGIAADVARKERRDGLPGHASEIEVTRSFEKKISLLLEEQRKAREIHAALVDLGLGEVGVDAEIQLQRRGDVVERVEPDIAVGSRGRSAGGRRRRQAAYGVGLQVEAQSLRDILQSVYAPGIDDAGEPLIERVTGPEALFIRATDRASKVDAPARQIRVEVQRSERDLDFGAPPGIGAAHSRRPDTVPRPVDTAAAVSSTAAATSAAATSTATTPAATA